jgi:hypothetical protein
VEVTVHDEATGEHVARVLLHGRDLVVEPAGEAHERVGPGNHPGVAVLPVSVGVGVGVVQEEIATGEPLGFRMEEIVNLIPAGGIGPAKSGACGAGRS